MKKCLMTVMAAVALGGMFVGCGNEMDLSGGKGSTEFNVVQNYENAFVTRFGQPAATQTWGFGSAASGTRAVVAQPYVSVGDYTYNAQMALAWEGVDAAIESGTPQSSFDFMNSYAAWHNSGWSDRYYDVHGTVVTSELSDEFVAAARQVIVGTGDQPGLIPENVNNLAKAQSTGYSIVTTGGPVTLTPIYHYSNSGDRLSYYYYPVGQKPTAEQIKTMPKYSLGEMSNPKQGGDTHLYNNTYSLVYVDANGNCSYDFPENYVINFVISNTWGGASNEIYQSGGITTVEGGTEASLTSQGKYQVPQNQTFSVGTQIDAIPDKVKLKYGSYPQFAKVKKGTKNTFDWGGDTKTEFEYYTEGNGVNGSLNGGSTVYYFQPKVSMNIAISVYLSAGKTMKMVKLNSLNATSGDVVESKTNQNQQSQSFNFHKWVEKDAYYAIYAEGSILGFYGFVAIGVGNVVLDKKNFTEGWGPFDFGQYNEFESTKFWMGRPADNFKAAGEYEIDGYRYYTSGAEKDGGLTAGATTYYFKPSEAGVLRVAVVLNSGKQFYVKDLGEDWYATSGTSLAGYDGITVSSKYYGTYDFPVEQNHVYAVYAEGSKLGFYGCEFLTGTAATAGTSSTSNIEKKTISTKPDYYCDSNMNAEIHSTTYGYGVGGYGVTDPLTSHAAVFQSKIGDDDITFIGFEDWVDFDFNDLVFAVTGTKTEKPQDPIEIPEDPEDPDEPVDPGTCVCRIVAEDLTVGENSDFDFNDVVFDVFCDASKSQTTIRLRAAGGELPLYVAGHEVHKEFGYNSSYPIINTGWDGTIDYKKRYVDFTISGVYDTRAAVNNIPVMVTKRGENKELIDILLTAKEGKVASKICVGRDYEWCSERLDIDKKYRRGDDKLFTGYVIGTYRGDWVDGTAWYQLK